MKLALHVAAYYDNYLQSLSTRENLIGSEKNLTSWLFMIDYDFFIISSNFTVENNDN